MKSVTLKSGATLSYREFGDPESSQIILYHHGFPGTGDEAGIAHRAALARNVRIIAPTRPGIADSTYEPARKILDWPETMLELLSTLRITQKISLLGVSGGTPYALACLTRFPEKISRTIVVSGMGPPKSVVFDSSMSMFSRIPIWCAYHLPGLGRAIIYAICAVSRRSPETLLACYKLCMSKDDRRLLRDETNTRNMLNNFRLALKQGAAPVYHDFRLLMTDWGFSLDDIREPVSFLHGGVDKLVPLSIARANVAAMSNASLKEYPSRGHFMAFEITGEIVELFTGKA